MTCSGSNPFSVDIYSVAGIIFVMVLHQVPFVYLTMRGPIMGMDPSYEEAARTAGASPWRMLRRVTLPMLSYALASSALLCLVLTLEQFGIPVLIGVPGHVTVLATQIYLLCRFPPTAYGLAAAIGLTLAAITGIAILLQRRLARGGRSVVTTGKAGRITPIPLGAWRWPVNLMCGFYIAVAWCCPSLILLYTSLIKFFTANPFDAAFTFRNYVYIWNSEETQRAIVNTMIVSGGGALVGVLLGVACSYFTVRLRPTGYRVLDALVMLPFGVPGIVLGLGLLWAYAYLPLPLYGTLTLIVLAYVTRFLPYATETAGARFVQLDRSLEEAAWTAGASRLSGVWRIVMPLSLPSLQSSYFLLFMAFFREISATILIFTASTSVLSVSIWSSFEQANWGLASALSILAMLLMVAMMSAAALGHARRAQAIEKEQSAWASPSATSSSPTVPLTVIHAISFDVADGEFVTLLGPERLRQDHDAALHRRPRNAERRQHRDQRPRRSPIPPPTCSCRRTSATSAWCSSPTRSGRI